MHLNTFIFVTKHTSDYAKAYRSVLLLNMSCRNSSQYNGAFSFDFMGFLGIPQGFPVTINIYKGISPYTQVNNVVYDYSNALC